jgi:hypothetical protein
LRRGEAAGSAACAKHCTACAYDGGGAPAVRRRQLQGAPDDKLISGSIDYNNTQSEYGMPIPGHASTPSKATVVLCQVVYSLVMHGDKLLNTTGLRLQNTIRRHRPEDSSLRESQLTARARRPLASPWGGEGSSRRGARWSKLPMPEEERGDQNPNGLCRLTACGNPLCRLPHPSWPAPPVTGIDLV